MTVDLKPFIKRLGNNDYVMVAGRLLMAHGEGKLFGVKTKMLKDEGNVVLFMATVTTDKGEFDGHAASYLDRGSPQEKKTPYEVAETSAVGRALGNAGFALEGGIASAEEVENALGRDEPAQPPMRRNVTNIVPRGTSGDPIGSLDHLEERSQEVEADPNDPEPYKRKVWAYLKANNVEGAPAREWVREKAKKDPAKLSASEWADLAAMVS